MNSHYTQFVLNSGVDTEEILATAYDTAVIVPADTPVYMGGFLHHCEGSVLHVNDGRIAVEVKLVKAV